MRGVTLVWQFIARVVGAQFIAPEQSRLERKFD